jgi:hypothetical protein
MNTDFNAMQVTMHHYKTLLTATKQRFAMAHIKSLKGLSPIPGKSCFLRHDVDLSPERALSMAEVEAACGMISTYYVLLRSPFYNALEAKNTKIWQRILSLGHEVGLHFDPQPYGSLSPTESHWVSAMQHEASILSNELQSPVESFSFHNPRVDNWDSLQQTQYGGFVNASCEQLRSLSFYGDSGGMLHKGSFPTYLEQLDSHASLYILIHPDWWYETLLSIEEKVIQAADHQYDAALRYWEYVVTSIGGSVSLRRS